MVTQYPGEESVWGLVERGQLEVETLRSSATSVCSCVEQSLGLLSAELLHVWSVGICRLQRGDVTCQFQLIALKT